MFRVKVEKTEWLGTKYLVSNCDSDVAMRYMR